LLSDQCHRSTSIHRRHCDAIQRILRSLYLPRPSHSPSQRGITIQPHFKRPTYPLALIPGYQRTPLLFQRNDTSFRSQYSSHEPGLCSLHEEQHSACSIWCSCWARRSRPRLCCLAEAGDQRWRYGQLGGSIQSQHCRWKPTCNLRWHARNVRSSIRCRVSHLYTAIFIA
jgi:hypothetical protein